MFNPLSLVFPYTYYVHKLKLSAQPSFGFIKATYCFNKHPNVVVLMFIIYVVFIRSHSGMSTLKITIPFSSLCT
jgi:hypothetical protein